MALNSECCHAEFPAMLSVIYAQCHIQQALYPECRYAKCCYAECHSADKNTSLQ